MKHFPWLLVDDDTVADGFVGWRCGGCGVRADFHAEGTKGEPQSSTKAPPENIDTFVDPCTRAAPASTLAEALHEAIERSDDEAWKAKATATLEAAAPEKALELAARVKR